MADQTFTLSELEKKSGLFAVDTKKYSMNSKYTQKEFNQLLAENLNDFHGVNYEARVAFLEENGYAVNRENLMNPELSVKPKDKE